MKALITTVVALALFLGGYAQNPQQSYYENPRNDYELCYNHALKETNRNFAPSPLVFLAVLGIEFSGSITGEYIDQIRPIHDNPDFHTEEGMRTFKEAAESKVKNDRDRFHFETMTKCLDGTSVPS